MKKAKYSKEDVENAVKNAITQKQALINLGLRAAGSNFKTLKKYINKYSIDISHFNPDGVRKKILIENGKIRTIPLNNILIKNSDYNRTNLKDRLYKEGLKKRKCELCGQGEMWNGKKMSLILDHINGVYNDNRIENLRIVCPNCNATLDTHCGKNCKSDCSDKKIICEKCGGAKQKASKFCKKCSDENRRVVERPLIGELKKDIEELGYSATGRKYGVSDSAIKKWINNYNKTNKKKCPECGKDIWLSANMCKECANLKKRKCERPQYDTLKEDVEKSGYIVTAKKYGITFRTLKRWIKDYEKMVL